MSNVRLGSSKHVLMCCSMPIVVYHYRFHLLRRLIAFFSPPLSTRFMYKTCKKLVIPCGRCEGCLHGC